MGSISSTKSEPRPDGMNHHIFDGTYGWMMKESQKQPSISLRISINKTDYEQLKLPTIKLQSLNAKSKKIAAITDTGAQSSLMGMKSFTSCGFNRSMLVPVTKKMYAANNEGIKIIGAFFARLSSHDDQGKPIEAAEMIYVSDSTDLFYLSRHAMQQLKIIAPSFPAVGAAASINDTRAQADTCGAIIPDVPPIGDGLLSNQKTCECLLRNKPPPRPSRLPFEPTEENNEKMKNWLLQRFASSTFNKCPHQPLPMMSGPPIKIHIKADAEPSAVHTPAQIPIHWREQIKEQLDADVALGVIEKVQPNTPSTWLMEMDTPTATTM